MTTQPSMTNRMIPPGIAADVAAERNYRSIQSERQLAAYDHQLTTRQQQIPGMLFPVYRLGELEPYTYVLRPERPRLGYDGKTIKYEWPERVPLCLDVLPRYRAALGDVTIPIWITEGAKKADALASVFDASIVPINLNGVWGWKQRGHDGASHPLEDLDHIAWAGRRVVLAFDNDVTRKPEVQDALKALKRHLSGRGAVVDVLYLPDTGEKLGVDDALAGGMSPEQLHAYISTNPEPAPPESSAGDLAELDTLTLEEWKWRYLAVLADRDRWKQRAEAAETALEQAKERNRFVTQATGANIAAAGKRDTLIELKKELDTAAGEGRQDGEWTRIRPKYMGKCTNQDEGTISRHLAEFAREGWIERACKRTKDPDTGKWTSASFVRPLIDLGDPSQVSLPAKPRGLSACEKCGSVKLKRRSVLRCTCCGHEQSTPEEWVNPKDVRAIEDEILANAVPNPALQTAIQEDAPAGDVAAFFEQLPEPATQVLNCSLQDTERGTESVLSSELQTAIHSPHTNRRQNRNVSPARSAAELAHQDAPPTYRRGDVWRAMWHAPDTDEPVTVIGLWDAASSPDGRAYYQVRESATGMPADEVELIALVDVPQEAPSTAAAAPSAAVDPELHDAIHPAPVQALTFLDAAPIPKLTEVDATAPGVLPLDPSTLPGVRSGLLAADDPWIALQQTLQAKAAP